MKNLNVNYRLLIVGFLVAVYAMFAYVFIVGDKGLENTDQQVERTYRVIEEVRKIATLTEGMLASHRGYALTGKQSSLDDYTGKRMELVEHMARLMDLTRDNPVQMIRIENLQHEIETFARELEERAKAYKAPVVGEDTLKDAEDISRMRNNILSLNGKALAEEYRELNQRIAAVDREKTRYYKTIALGGTLALGAVLVFNLLIFRTLMGKAAAERTLRTTEERLKLAIEGTTDGIFDWNIELDTVFYSRQFFSLLGEERNAYIGTIEDFRERLHPDDAGKVWQHMESYLGGELSEYSATFRLRHASGRWIWVTSRAKAIFDDRGTAVRMVGAITDVTHLHEQQERLKHEKQAAEEASQLKTEFLAHMSHEIRTPLTAISGIAEIFMGRQENLNEKQKQLIRTLHSSTGALKDLVNDLLDYSKIESGELSLAEKSLPLDVFFQHIISLMSVTAAEKGLFFTFDYSDVDGREIIADDIRLRQILINLIGNAIKFTDEGSVTVTARCELHDGGPWLEVRVEDTGIGIGEENFERVFERFQQVDDTISRKYGGTGLGLPISRKLADMMGGSISLASTPGKGSVFTVLIPWREEAGAASGAAPEKKARAKIRARLQKEDRILLVEDYEGNIVVISYIMEDLGCAYDVAHNGEEALELWKAKHYDAILMDVQMPVMDGFAATQAIRQIEADKKLARTPVIGMTAHALANDKEKCFEAGMDAYIPKPIIEDDMKRVILDVFRNKAA